MSKRSNDDSGAEGRPLAVTGIHRIVTLAVLVHLVVVGMSIVSTVGQSQTTATWMMLAGPYLQATHFGLDETPIYITHGKRVDQPRTLSIERSDETRRRSLLPARWAGMGSDDRQQRMLRAVESLVDADQPSLAAHLIAPLIPPVARDGDIIVMRREPTLLSSAEDDTSPPPYRAHLVSKDEDWSIVQWPETRLTAASDLPEPTAP
ncbi:MAG: hypothetical protein AAGJ40_18080 [Planctomycetota bacterium]